MCAVVDVKSALASKLDELLEKVSALESKTIEPPQKRYLLSLMDLLKQVATAPKSDVTKSGVEKFTNIHNARMEMQKREGKLYYTAVVEVLMKQAVTIFAVVCSLP